MTADPAIAPAANEPVKQPSCRRANHLWFWLVLALVVLATESIRFRLRDMALERDEGEYAYAGQLLLQGIPPYRLAYNMKFPGTYLAYAAMMAVFGQTPAGVHLGFMVVNAAGIVLVYLLGARLAGRGAGLAAAALYAYASVSQAFLGTAAHATHFVVVPALGGLLLLLRGLEVRSSIWLVLSGVLLGTAVLMKQPGAAFVVSAMAFLIYQRAGSRDWRGLAREGGWFGLGVALPLALTAVWLWQGGVFGKFWFWTIQYAREYATEVTQPAVIVRLLLERAPVVVWIVFCGALPGLAVLWCKRERSAAVFATGLFVLSFLATFPSFNFWPHYFILWLPCASVLTGVTVCSAGEFLRRRNGFAALLPAVIFAGALIWGVFRERVLFFQSTPLQAVRLVYGWNPFPESEEIGAYIDAHAAKDARIAVVGSEPQIYFFAHRHSATGHIYVYGLMEPQPYALQMQREMIQEIETNRPEYLVWEEIATAWGVRPGSNPLIFDWSEKYFNAHYERVGVVDIFPGVRTDYRWGEEAQKHPPASGAYLSILKRKPEMP